MCITHAVASVLYLAAVAACLPIVINSSSTPTWDSKDTLTLPSGPHIQIYAMYPNDLKVIPNLPHIQVNPEAKPHNLTPDELELQWQSICRMTAKHAQQRVDDEYNYLRFADKSAKHVESKMCKLPDGTDVSDNVWREMNPVHNSEK